MSHLLAAPKDRAMEGATAMMSATHLNESANPLKAHEIGMDNSIKTLYSGKEDEQGRFQWSAEKPEDLGTPAQDAESAKAAIIVRYARTYGDPEKVVRLDSIVVQSPLLRELLDEVLAGYPGVASGLKKLEFSGRFESLIHRWPALRARIAALEQDRDGADEADQADLAKRMEHVNLLNDLLLKELSAIDNAARDMTEHGVTTYEHMWTIFQPGAIVYAKRENQDRAFRLQSSYYGKDRDGNPCFWLSCVYVDYDGQSFGVQALNIQIDKFSGTRPVAALSAYPIELHEDAEQMQSKLIERGGKAEALAGTHYRSYNGVGFRLDHYQNKEKTTVRGRIVVDGFGFNRFNADQAVYVRSLTTDTTDKTGKTTRRTPPSDYRDRSLRFTFSRSGASSSYYNSNAVNEDDGGMPADGLFEDDLTTKKRAPLIDEQKMICSPMVRGYALREKVWLNFFVNAVTDVSFSENAFEALTLPKDQKSLILAFCDNKNADRSQFDDVIAGKGRGLVILLSGPPGVGKTLTAESVAEQLKVPLFPMAAGDLGIDSRTVESKLNECLDMCSRWKAVLLLDEADIFLEQRNLHELERNKLVSIFLRVLEHYEGIMFLTTNRVETFDQAFQSRIHLSLQYPDLDYKSRKGIWDTFLKRLPKGHEMSEGEVRKLAQMELNGREIKNFLKSAQLLATHREEALKYEHVETVVDTMAHLHKASKASREAKGAIFN